MINEFYLHIDSLIRKEKAQAYANYIFQLLDKIIDSGNNKGDFILYEQDFDLLGKDKVPCSYNISEDEIILTLDYSFRVSLFCKSFDSAKIDLFYLRNILKEKNIDIVRVSDHPELEETDPFECKDKLIISVPNRKNKILERKVNL